MISARTQMAVLSWSMAAVTLAGAVYIAVAAPSSLGQSRYGVPHLTPQVLDPATGKGIPVDVLVRSYKGEGGAGKVYY